MTRLNTSFNSVVERSTVEHGHIRTKLVLITKNSDIYKHHNVTLYELTAAELPSQYSRTNGRYQRRSRDRKQLNLNPAMNNNKITINPLCANLQISQNRSKSSANGPTATLVTAASSHDSTSTSLTRAR